MMAQYDISELMFSIQKKIDILGTYKISEFISILDNRIEQLRQKITLFGWGFYISFNLLPALASLVYLLNFCFLILLILDILIIIWIFKNITIWERKYEELLVRRGQYRSKFLI